MISGLSLLAGVLLALGAARLPQASWAWMAAAASASVLLSPIRRVALARRLALLLAGLTLACLSIARWQEARLLPGTADSRVLLEGIVLTVPARRGAELFFDAEVRVREGQAAGDRLRRARLAWRDPAIEPRVGERWRLVARLGTADSFSNFTGPDLERAAFRERVHFSAQVLPAALNARLSLADDSIDGLRAWIALRIAGHVDDPDAAALITALAVGLTSGMSTDQWRVFNATGTTHLVAISGLHVTLFALLAFWVARTLWRCLPFPGFVEREPFALSSGLVAAGGYSLLAGFSVPTQRTWVMLAVFAGARLCARHVGAGRTWSLALIAVLLFDAFAPLAAGFWLSFIAVGVILAIESTALSRAPRIRRAITLQLSVTLALAPLTLAVFGGVSLVGIAVNLVAIPVISFLFVPLVLAGGLASWLYPSLDGLLYGAAARLYEWLWPAMVSAADVEFAQWRLDPPLWWYALAVPAAVLMLRWPLVLRLTAAACVLPLVFPLSRLPEPGDLRVSVLDAGGGSAVLLATHGHVLLFDTGDAWNTHGSRVARVVNPALDALGTRRVDLLILPALNPERAAGAASLAVERGVQRILSGGGWPGTSLPVARCGDAHFRWEGVDFETFAAGQAADACVLRVTAGAHSLLLAGDLDTSAERQLLARLAPRSLASDVVVMSRQASASGSSPQWIDSTRAAVAVATGGVAGSNARAETIARWRAAGAQVFDTRRDGGIEFCLGTHGIAVRGPARAARYPFAWRRFQ